MTEYYKNILRKSFTFFRVKRGESTVQEQADYYFQQCLKIQEERIEDDKERLRKLEGHK